MYGRRFESYVLLAVGVLVVCGAAPAQTTKTSAPVTVVNTDSSPVPVSGSVNIANTPSVTVSGTPSVNVAALPAVNLSGTPSVNVANTPGVNITNPATQPVPTFNVDNPARSILAAQHFYTSNLCNDEVIATVPANKVGVVEFVSGSVVVNPGDGAVFELDVTSGGNHVGYELPMVKMPDIFGDKWALAQPLRVYADGGTNITASMCDANGTAEARTSRLGISGYLVPATR
jgi:hypothetical protein